jgi:hypothetical protein
MSNFTYSDELYHYGTKGMRWDFGIIDKDAISEASTANLVRSMLSYEPALKKLRQ